MEYVSTSVQFNSQGICKLGKLLKSMRANAQLVNSFYTVILSLISPFPPFFFSAIAMYIYTLKIIVRIVRQYAMIHKN